ncbi:MAG: hypothetical protein FWD35_03400 [Oscillospiraceae bacterium]|nr:hypothetical protein [Oscillospiraceae bacterium]
MSLRNEMARLEKSITELHDSLERVGDVAEKVVKAVEQKIVEPVVPKIAEPQYTPKPPRR